MVMKFHRYSMPDLLFQNVLDFDRGIDTLFGDFFDSPFDAHLRAYPRIDVVEYGDRTELVAELPGLNREDVKISIHDGVLTLKGERKRNSVPENAVWIRNEIQPGEFARTIQLPHQVNLETVSAELADGVLCIVLPKAEKARLREIAIR
jgi:HSP20 family protein